MSAMPSIGWIGLHAHRPPERGGTDWNRFCTTPDKLFDYVTDQLQRPHDKFYFHQPAPWHGDNPGMAAGQFYCVGRDAVTPQKEYRDALVNAIRVGRQSRPDITIGIYGGLLFETPCATRAMRFWHPTQPGDSWGMFERNVLEWQRAGVTEWWLDAGSKADRRVNALFFKQLADGFGIETGIEAFCVEGWDDDEDTHTFIQPQVARMFPAVADARFVYNGKKQSPNNEPWEIPTGSKPHYIMLHKNINLWDVPGVGNVPPDDPRLAEFWQQCKERGYRFGCDYRYDELVRTLSQG